MKHTRNSNPAIGRKVVALETSTRRYAVGFPGWNAPNYEAFLLEIPRGLAGVIAAVEQHVSNPWTRYAVTFHDGTRANGLIVGQDIRMDNS